MAKAYIAFTFTDDDRDVSVRAVVGSYIPSATDESIRRAITDSVQRLLGQFPSKRWTYESVDEVICHTRGEGHNCVLSYGHRGPHEADDGWQFSAGDPDRDRQPWRCQHLLGDGIWCGLPAHHREEEHCQVFGSAES